MNIKLKTLTLVISGLMLGAAAGTAMAEDAPASTTKPIGTFSAARIDKLAQSRATTLAGHWCQACHGRGGKGDNPLFPVLAAQSSEYIQAQLTSFHNLTQDDTDVTHETIFERWVKNITGWRKPYTAYVHDDSDDNKYDNAPRNEERAWDFMKGVARDLDEPTIKALADYFSKQPAIEGRTTAEPAVIARGKSMFEEGDANKGLLACQMCHGPDGKGQGPIPRLAGQHADYVVVQLKAIQSGQRTVDQMQALIANLDEADLRAVAEFVQSMQ